MGLGKWLATAAFVWIGCGWAWADELRDCRPEELENVQPAPMPKEFRSIIHVRANSKQTAGYLIDIAGDGTPKVVCVIGVMTDAYIRKDAAEAVEAFQYWPEDTTAGNGAQYIHLTADSNGMKIPSVLPRKTDPLCTGVSASAPGVRPEAPIFKPNAVFPYDHYKKPMNGDAHVTMRVSETGAPRLICRATGDNSEAFKMAAYYYAAQFRFSAKPGRPPFEYSVHIQYRQ